MLKQSTWANLFVSALALAPAGHAQEPTGADRVLIEVQSVLEKAGLPAAEAGGGADPYWSARGIDPPYHLRLRVRLDAKGVTVLQTEVGEGPPRSYLAEPDDVVFLLAEASGSEIHRVQLADPREVRVYEPAGAAAHGSDHAHDWARRTVAEVDVFLPVLPGLATVEVIDGGAALKR